MIYDVPYNLIYYHFNSAVFIIYISVRNLIFAFLNLVIFWVLCYKILLQKAMFRDHEQEDFKKKREQFSVNLRKANREEIFNKRRNLGQLSDEVSIEDSSTPNGLKIKIIIIDKQRYNQILEMINTEYTEEMIPQLLQCVFNHDILKKHQGVIGIRKLISTEVDPPIQPVIDAGIIQECINMIKQDQYPQLKLEATWVLTNIASGTAEQTHSLVEKDVIPLMIQLLHENQYGIVDQAIWAIGNIAADSIKYRDKILHAGGMNPLIKIVESSQSKVIIKNGAWTISNLVRGYPPPKYQLVKPCLETMAKVVIGGVITEKEVVSDCIWSLSYLSEGPKSRVQRLLETGVTETIFKFLTDPYTGLSIPALRILGNYSTGNEYQTQELIKFDFFTQAMTLLDHPKKAMRRETCWVLSNIAAGTASQVDTFLYQEALLNKLLDKLDKDLSEIKRQICWIFANFGHLGNPAKIVQLYMQCDIIRYFENLLTEEDQKTLEHVIECLTKILDVGIKAAVNKENVLVKRLYNSNILKHIEELQEHKSPKVYEKIVKLIQKHFEVENPLF